jgi:hypothetical protein
VVLVLAVAAWLWPSCDDAREEATMRPALLPPALEEKAPALDVDPVAEPPAAVAAPPLRTKPDAGARGWDLGRVVTGRSESQVPPVIRQAVEAARAECEKKVTRWFSGEGHIVSSLDLEATDAGVSVGFRGETPLLRCMKRLVEPQRFELELPSPSSAVMFVDDRPPPTSGGALPSIGEVVALLKKCLPSGTTKSPLSLTATASVRGNEVVVDRPVLEATDLDAWARSCIELGLMRTVAFDEDSRPSWSSVSIELQTDALGKNAHAHMTYQPP